MHAPELSRDSSGAFVVSARGKVSPVDQAEQLVGPEAGWPGAAVVDMGRRCRLPDTCLPEAAALDRPADTIAVAADLPVGSPRRAAQP